MILSTNFNEIATQIILDWAADGYKEEIIKGTIYAIAALWLIPKIQDIWNRINRT